jgi:hypothetical protein
MRKQILVELPEPSYKIFPFKLTFGMVCCKDFRGFGLDLLSLVVIMSCTDYVVFEWFVSY